MIQKKIIISVMIWKCCWKSCVSCHLVINFSTLSPQNKIILYLRWEHRQQALQPSRCLISATHDCEKVAVVPGKELALHSVPARLIWKQKAGLWKGIRYSISPRLVSPPPSATRLNCSAHNGPQCQSSPKSAFRSGAGGEKKWNKNDLYNRSELELIKHPVSSFLWEIASVFRCVKK